jgi:hypothetical protein
MTIEKSTLLSFLVLPLRGAKFKEKENCCEISSLIMEGELNLI